MKELKIWMAGVLRSAMLTADNTSINCCSSPIEYRKYFLAVTAAYLYDLREMSSNLDYSDFFKKYVSFILDDVVYCFSLPFFNQFELTLS